MRIQIILLLNRSHYIPCISLLWLATHHTSHCLWAWLSLDQGLRYPFFSTLILGIRCFFEGGIGPCPCCKNHPFHSHGSHGGTTVSPKRQETVAHSWTVPCGMANRSDVPVLPVPEISKSPGLQNFAPQNPRKMGGFRRIHWIG